MKNKSSPCPAVPSAPFEVPAKWRWHLQTLLKLRDRLQRQAHAHLAEAEALPRTEVDFAERAADESDFENLISSLKSEEGWLAEVESALSRLQAGTYGVCGVTHEPIPAERLRAVPWTCITRDAAERMKGNAG